MTEPVTLSVGQLHAQLAALLRARFPDEVWVTGEVASKRAGANGHVYLDLVERPAPGAPPSAVLKVVVFASQRAVVNAQLRAVPGVTISDGVEVRVRGRLAAYAPQGSLQLVMSAIDPSFTLGRLAASRDALLRALAADGLLERNAALPLPAAPLRVGLVTSFDSAAYHDFVDELSRSGFAFQVLVADTRVQGESAPAHLVAALREFARRAVSPGWRPDVVVLVRGGGSRTDLAAFDAEPVARAVAAMPVPVLTGVGHEVDRSVADEVAHSAFKTPTAVAQHLVARVADTAARTERVFEGVLERSASTVSAAAVSLQHVSQALVSAAAGRLARSGDRLADVSARLARSGSATLAADAAALGGDTERLCRVSVRTLAVSAERLEAASATVGAYDPARVLARGFAVVRGPDGRVLTDAGALAVGAQVVATLASGSFTGTVTGTVTGTAPAPDAPDVVAGTVPLDKRKG